MIFVKKHIKSPLSFCVVFEKIQGKAHYHKNRLGTYSLSPLEGDFELRLLKEDWTSKTTKCIRYV